MSAPLLHVAAFWVDEDCADEVADMLAKMKVRGSRGAVVTFALDVASDPRFEETMRKLALSEVNDRSFSLIPVSPRPTSPAVKR